MRVGASIQWCIIISQGGQGSKGSLQAKLPPYAVVVILNQGAYQSRGNLEETFLKGSTPGEANTVGGG